MKIQGCFKKQDANRPVIREINAQFCCREILFLDTPTPEISWKTNGFRQAGYRIMLKDSQQNVICLSEKIADTQSQWRPWPNRPLNSRERVMVQVELFDKFGRTSNWSEPVICEYTLSKPSDWGKARWIWFDRVQYVTTPPSPYFRRLFSVRKNLVRAELFITARGVFEAFLNGKKIGNDLLAPGWVDFRTQTPYMSYDITTMIQNGMNVLGVVLADGWCCGNLTIYRFRNFYHEHPELLAHLELTFADGSVKYVDTDSSWKVSTGPILSADLYDGEFYDARQEKKDWLLPKRISGVWYNAAEGDRVDETPELVQRTAPPVRVTEEIAPVKILNPKKDCYIWDFGQNFTGTFRVRLRGTNGQLYTFRTGEMLEKDGSLYTLNYRGAQSQDHYICKGPLSETEVYTPHFTFHGFRYLQIDGFQFDKIPPEELEVSGLVIRSNMLLKGGFSCANPLVTRLWQNALWGQKSNFLELPTDCPQRDERLGWTGDTQVFAPAAVLNMDCCSFYRKYLRDVREAMTKEGAAPSIAPAILHILDGSAGWGDAVVLIPMLLYRHYGWKKILAENYEAMCRSVDYQIKNSEKMIRTDHSFCDWLAPQRTTSSFISTAFMAHCTDLVSQTAGILDKKKDQKHYNVLAQKIKACFQKQFIGPDGLLTEQTQTAIVLSLAFDLLPNDTHEKQIRLLEKIIRENGNRLSTGFLGTPYLLPVLEKYGCYETARTLLLQEEIPSWLYSVKQGATTIWERWNSFSLADGFGDVKMNSFNHYAYGIVSRYLIESIGGLHYQAEKLEFKIVPDKRFSPVEASYDSPYGKIVSHWQLDEAKNLFWEVEVPTGIPARAILPDGCEYDLSPGKYILCDGTNGIGHPRKNTPVI